MFNPSISLTYRDIALKPNRISIVSSRSEVVLNDTGALGHRLSLPVISSPMRTVTGSKMASTLAKVGCFAVLARHFSSNESIKIILEDKDVNPAFLAASVGMKTTLAEIRELLQLGIRTICIDVANGFARDVLTLVSNLREHFPSLKIIAGNVASIEGYEALSEAGAHAVRIGIGNGSVCLDGESLITTINGQKMLKDVKIGDIVLTHTGEFQKVTEILNKNTDKLLEINGIRCTPDHKFYVIDKTNQFIVTEENLHHFGKWIKAEDLSAEHLIIERYV